MTHSLFPSQNYFRNVQTSSILSSKCVFQEIKNTIIYMILLLYKNHGISIKTIPVRNDILKRLKNLKFYISRVLKICVNIEQINNELVAPNLQTLSKCFKCTLKKTTVYQKTELLVSSKITEPR